ncbi:homocysteine S-methyltransferase family protein [Candidatus Epulonipiscium viviparus]|uniref:homocysteine S-methyltransferase family protein n=1 Tax=Candidatus Epulonipiscium viviparus TaxID=420336 RepID=UPI0027380E21|nr:homocysteine S-methyltransferase family protein [Candidatus Epulopiscium viviparus]
MNITFLDGALGSNLLQTASANVFELNLTHPDLVAQLHREYVAAGAQIVASNTFGVNRISAAKTNYAVGELIEAGLQIAFDAISDTDTAKVAFDIGPLPALLEPFGDLSEEECSEIYAEILASGISQKPNYIFFETFMDVEMLKLAVAVADNYDVPILAAMSFLPVGKTIMGNSVDDFLAAMSKFKNVVAVGLNCSDTPTNLAKVVQEFAAKSSWPIIIKPNAGLPQSVDGEISYATDAEFFAAEMAYALQIPNAYVGGCCGTTPLHIQQLVVQYSK